MTLWGWALLTCEFGCYMVWGFRTFCVGVLNGCTGLMFVEGFDTWVFGFDKVVSLWLLVYDWDLVVLGLIVLIL